MDSQSKTKEELLDELQKLQAKITELEQATAQRKQVEEHLLESESRFQAFVDYSPVPAWITLDEDVIAYFNKAYGRLFDINLDQVEGKRSLDIFPAEVAQRCSDSTRTVLTTNQTLEKVEPIFKPDGTVSEAIVYKFPLTNTAGQKLVGGMVIDITRYKRAEESNRFQAHLLDTVEQAVIATTVDGTILYWNRFAQQLYGWEAQETLGRNIKDIIPPVETLRGKAEDIRTQVRSGQSWSGDYLMRRRNGSTFVALVTNSPIYNEAGEMTGIVGISTDITARKRTEEALRQSQKMEAVGRLAGGVAHDFNNILTGILGYAELVLQELMEDDLIYDDIRQIKTEGERAVNLVKQLLTFSRQQVLQPGLVRLNNVVESVQKLLKRLIGEDIELSIKLEPQLGTIKADFGQIEQIVLNLAINARDAMLGGGKLIIETKNVDLETEYDVQQVQIAPGQYVALSVSDSGHGMDAETVSRIFEPFFSTKEPGKGTGLGLATVYGIVEQNQGHIKVYSEVGVGTTLTVYLPVAANEVEQKQITESRPPKLQAGNSKTLLVVEDEPGVRRLVCKILERGGYRILEASEPAEAIKICEEHSGPIDLLITDVIMPKINGGELARQISHLKPAIQVLYTSGYTDGMINQHGILESDVAFLQKPFTSNSLLTKVQELLNLPPADA